MNSNIINPELILAQDLYCLWMDLAPVSRGFRRVRAELKLLLEDRLTYQTGALG